jgi:hypothetical protein
MRWKVVGELVRPKNMTFGTKMPNSVLNAALWRSSRRIRMLLYPWHMSNLVKMLAFRTRAIVGGISVTFPSHVTSTSAIEKGKWLEWRDAPERTDSSGSNGPVMPDLDLDDEESFIMGRLVSTDVIEHETDHVPDYGEYGVMSGRLALS